MRFRNLLIGLCLFAAFMVHSQNRGSAFYLLGKIDESRISAHDKSLLDSMLTAYHATGSDSVRTIYLRILSENLTDQELWPAYNKLLYEFVKNRQGAFYGAAKATALNSFGYEAQYLKNDLFAAKSFYLDAYNEFKRIDNAEGMAVEINNMAFIFQHEGNVGKSVELYSEALALFLERNNLPGITTSYINLGDIYLGNTDYEKAREAFEKALAYAVKSGNKLLQANALNQLGVICKRTGQPEKSYGNYKKAYEIYLEAGDRARAAVTLINYCNYFIDRKEYAEAVQNFGLALRYARESGESQALARVYSNFGDFYAGQKEDDKALPLYDSAYKYAKIVGYPDLVYTAADMLAKLWSQKKDYKRSYAYMREAYVMRDSITNDRMRNATLKAQYRTEYEVKEAQMKAEQEKKDEQRKSEKKQERIILWFMGLAVLLASLAAFIAYRGFLVKKRSENLLQEKNRIISEQKRMVENKQKEIVDSIHYARRIQRALIANERYIDQTLRRLSGEKTVPDKSQNA